VCLLAILLALLGGFLTGLAMDYFRADLGAIVLWGSGALAGWLGRKLTTQASRAMGWSLVAACIVAFAIALVCWIRWNIVGVASWWEALQLLPAAVQQYRVTVFVGAIFTLFGALSAYRQTTANR
jgi:hypothetical protein